MEPVVSILHYEESGLGSVTRDDESCVRVNEVNGFRLEEVEGVVASSLCVSLINMSSVINPGLWKRSFQLNIGVFNVCHIYLIYIFSFGWGILGLHQVFLLFSRLVFLSRSDKWYFITAGEGN